MKSEVVLTPGAHDEAASYLLRDFQQGIRQERLCFALWRPSRGVERFTGVVRELILPGPDEVNLHGNVSFEGKYLTRAVHSARRQNAGLAMLHSHPYDGWQDMSEEDVVAERDVVAYQAQATGQALLGMTVGTDGYWSARFWRRHAGQMVLNWCDKVRIPRRDRYQINWHPSKVRRHSPNPMLRRTVATWGIGVQAGIQRLCVGVVGVGSVGAIAAEALARLGVSEIVLIDPDRIELHNLDRLLFATRRRVGDLKVDVARQNVIAHSTHEHVRVRAIPVGIEYRNAYRAALDCDVLLSCVDRPVPRDILNYIAIASGIPVLDAGVSVHVNAANRTFESARWRSHLVVPGNACLRCTQQYSTSDVVAELDGSLDDPSYLQNLPIDKVPQTQNVFPFSLGCASMQVNHMVRYVIAEDWWPDIQGQEYRFLGGTTKRWNEQCKVHCAFRQRVGLGSDEEASYLKPPVTSARPRWLEKMSIKIGSLFGIRKR